MYADQARPFGFFSAAILCVVGLWGLFAGGAHAWYWIAAAVAVAVVTRAFLMDYFRELWSFLKSRKKLWLLPIILVLLLLGGLIVFVQGSAIAPFIYTVF